MKRKFNALGLLSLLALIAPMGWLTGEPGWYGFCGFAYYLRYFAVQPDELFRENFRRAGKEKESLRSEDLLEQFNAISIECGN